MRTTRVCNDRAITPALQSVLTEMSPFVLLISTSSQFYMLCNSFAHTHTFLEVLKKGLLSCPLVENSSRQPVRRIPSRVIFYKAYLKRAREREEAKGCHQGSEELISETVLKQYE